MSKDAYTHKINLKKNHTVNYTSKKKNQRNDELMIQSNGCHVARGDCR